MNRYVCFFKTEQIEVEAETSYKAQVKAAQIFKAKREYEVSVTLAQKADGEVVVHTTVD